MKNKIKNFGLILMFSIVGQNSYGGIKISIDDAVEMSLSNHANIRKLGYEKQSHEFMLKQVKSAYGPNIEADFLYMNHPESTVSDSLKQQQLLFDYTSKASLTIKQPLYTFGKIENNVKVANSAVEASKMSLKKAKLKLISEVKKAYIGVQTAERVKKIYENSYLNAQKNKFFFEKRFQNARPPQSDIIQLSRDVSSRNSGLISSTTNLKNSLNYLSSLVGKDIGVKNELNDNIEIDDLKKIFKTLDKNSYDLSLAKINIDIKEHQLQAKKSDFYPSIGAFASLNYFGRDDSSTFKDNEIQKVGAIGVSITIPIWDFGSKSAAKAKALMDKKASQEGYIEAKRQLFLGVQNLFNQFHSLKEEIKSNKKFLSLAKKTFEMSQKRFSSGQTSVSEVNDTEQLLTQANLQLAQNIYQLNLTKINIEELTGGNFDE